MQNKHTNLWWGPPKNFSDRKNERKISWLELFYDLVYVAAIAQLTHHLAMSIVGACIKVLLPDMELNLHYNVKWMFCLSLATILFMIVSLTKIMQEDLGDNKSSKI